MTKKRFTSVLLALLVMISLLLIQVVSASQDAYELGVKKQLGPEENLPPNIRRLTYFGERASWSPDGKKIAFMSKSFGDAFEIELATGHIRLLTGFPHAGYLRVQYLPNGDYLLVGARQFSDIKTTRYSDQELWYMSATPGAKPIALNQKLTEGIAISRNQLKVAWAMDSRTSPDDIPSGEAVVYVGDITLEEGEPRLVNKRVVQRLARPDCVGGEPQDFRNKDMELVYVCYRLNEAKLPSIVMLADVMGVNLETGKNTVYRKLRDEYNEVEGIFPDGQYTLVESSKNQSTSTSRTIDIWKLRLQPDSDDFKRLTHWGDYKGYKASNPVVSPNGEIIAFQSARSSEEAGVGHGIFLLNLQ